MAPGFLVSEVKIIITRIGIALLILLGVVTFGIGQDLPAQPSPGPEHKKLAGLVGEWSSVGELTAGPLGPAAKWKAKLSTKWHDGQFAVVRHMDGLSSAQGKITAIDLIAYDPDAKGYVWYSIDSRGGMGVGKVTIEGDTLTVVWDEKTGEKAYKVRGTLKGLGSDKLTWVAEYSDGSDKWTPYFRASDTRVKK